MKRGLFVLVLLLALAVWIFRSLLASPFNLLDQNDQLFTLFTLHNQGLYWVHGLFGQLLELPVFVPLQHVGLFSDLLLPIGLLFGIVERFLHDPILTFKAIFFLGLGANIVTAYWLASFISPKNLVRLAISLFLVFGSYFFVQYLHFQMIVLPLFFASLTLIFRGIKTKWDACLYGILIGLQWWTAVYLGVFLTYIFGLWIVVKLWQQILKRDFNLSVYGQKVIYFVLPFIALVLPLVVLYKQTQSLYGFSRSAGEYVSYAAHITDYVFPIVNSSLFNSIPIVESWSRLNHHTSGEIAVFPGFVLMALFFTECVYLYKKRKRLDFVTILLFLIGISGFIFSLGPRCNFNGHYCVTPFPYFLLLKFVPLFEPVRATARWFLLLYVAITLLAGRALARLPTKLILLCMGLFIIETVPLHLPYWDASKSVAAAKPLTALCVQRPGILLEYPLHNMTASSENEGLAYKTAMLLEASYHGCSLINGYSGFTPREIDVFDQKLNQSIADSNLPLFLSLLKSRSVTYLQIHTDHLPEDIWTKLSVMLRRQSYFVLSSQSPSRILYVVK